MLLDANLLIYAVDESTRQHEAARDWLTEQLSGSHRVGLPWVSLGAFLRIMTRRGALDRPLAPEDAWGFVDAWLTATPAWVPTPGAGHAQALGSLITKHRVTGDLVTDAQLAALAIEHGLTVYSTDSDFARFPEVRWVNPLH
jgi:toxin-antitoxin system PIN domain toxin